MRIIAEQGGAADGQAAFESGRLVKHHAKRNFVKLMSVIRLLIEGDDEEPGGGYSLCLLPLRLKMVTPASTIACATRSICHR
jgi:hypothetical protein